MPISAETKKILSSLIACWEDAAKSERDLDEIEAFTKPAWKLTQALEGTHDDIRKVIPNCPIYPKWGKASLQELADAERDGKRVVITENGRGFTWAIQ